MSHHAYSTHRKIWEYDDTTEKYYNYGEYEDVTEYGHKTPGTSSKIFLSSKKMNGPTTPRPTPKRRRGSTSDSSSRKRSKSVKKAAKRDRKKRRKAAKKAAKSAKKVAFNMPKPSSSTRFVDAFGKPPDNKIVKLGALISDERGWNLQSSDSVYVGHTTHAIDLMFKGIAHALVKKLLNKARIYFETFDEALTITTSQSTNLLAILYYRETQDPSETTLPFQENFTFGGAGGQWNTPAKLAILLQGVFVGTYKMKGPNVSFENFDLYPTQAGVIPYTRLILKGAKIHYDVTSTLRVQNQTTPSVVQDESVDVNAAPLIGNLYQGSGNGMEVVGNTAGYRPFIADKIYGLIAKSGVQASGQTQDLREPIPREQTKHVDAFKGMQVEPGEMVNNALWENKKVYLNSIIRQLSRFVYIDHTPDPAVPAFMKYPYTSSGKFAIMGLEKKLEIYNPDGTITTQVLVACERNYRLMICMYEGKQYNTQVTIHTQGKYNTTQTQ